MKGADGERVGSSSYPERVITVVEVLSLKPKI